MPATYSLLRDKPYAKKEPRANCYQFSRGSSRKHNWMNTEWFSNKKTLLQRVGLTRSRILRILIPSRHERIFSATVTRTEPFLHINDIIMVRLLHFQFNNARYAWLTQSNYVDFLTNRYTRTLSSTIYCFKWLLFDRSVFVLSFSSPSTPFCGQQPLPAR